MNTTKSIYLVSALLVLLLTSACGAKNTAAPDSGSPPAGAGQASSAPAQEPAAESGNGSDAGSHPGESDQADAANGDAAAGGADQTGTGSDTAGNAEAPPAVAQDNGTKDDGQPETDAGKAILIIIDQTPKPTTGNSFDFAINKLPEGYMLTELQWVSAKNQIKNTFQEAIEHGQTGEDGFYISGDGQFMGFFYPDALKGEEGQVKFVFTNDQGKKLTWQKTITLK